MEVFYPCCCGLDVHKKRTSLRRTRGAKFKRLQKPLDCANLKSLGDVLSDITGVGARHAQGGARGDRHHPNS